jgi:sulfotransferase famil protein
LDGDRRLRIVDAMIVSKKSKFIFVHVPKTGGLSVRMVLCTSYVDDVEEIFRWHCRARDAAKFINNWNSYFSFGFVRNPWEAQLSMYTYVVGMGSRHPEGQKFSMYGSFGSYLDRHIQGMWEAGQLCNQADFLYSREDECLVSFIGRHENLDRDFNKVRNKLGRPLSELPRLNQSEHGPYRDYYDTNSKALVEKMFRKDIERFDYAF